MDCGIGKIIRERRIELGLTQKAVALQLGVSRPVVAKWERGEARPSLERIRQLAQMLDMPVERLSAVRPARGRPRRAEHVVVRRKARPPYPISATVEQMLRLRGCARPLWEEVRATISDEEYRLIVEEFPRDARHELLAVFHVMRQNTRLIVTSPEMLDCPLMVLDDYAWVYGGNQRQLALLWEGEGECFVMFPQVRVRGAGRWAYRLDFLVCYKRRGQAAHWMFIELDGKDHEETPNEDAQRAEGIGFPEQRYDNERVRRPDFFDRLLSDIRRAARLAAKWAEERAEKAETEYDRRKRKAAEKRLAA